MDKQNKIKKFLISVSRESEKIAVATTHGVSLKISMSGPEPELGFTAPETLIAAYGACVLTNIGKAAKALSVNIRNPRVDFTAIKNNEPLGVKDVNCTISVESSDSEERVREALEKATNDGTATNAIHEGIRATFSFNVK